MKIQTKEQGIHHDRPEGISALYHLFKEYHFVYGEQPPGTRQPWHYHEKVHESLFIIDGELLAEWKEGDDLHQVTVKSGDFIETEQTPHSFVNNSNQTVRYIVIKQILSGEDKRLLLEKDRYPYEL